jgi:hypothetical protein
LRPTTQRAFTAAAHPMAEAWHFLARLLLNIHISRPDAPVEEKSKRPTINMNNKRL